MVRILGRANSINVEKVMWTCAEIGLDVERIDVGGAYGGNKEAAYLAKNPTGLVPTLEDNGFILWESQAIVRYLSEKYGSSPWYPAKIEDRGLCGQWMDFYPYNLHAHMTVIFWNLVRTPEPQRDMPAVEAAVEKASVFWGMVNDNLAKNAFLTGTAPCMGDVPLGCAVHRWYNLDIKRPDLPHLERWYGKLTERIAYQEHVMVPIT